MFGKTVRLFVKALVIGILINLGLQLFPPVTASSPQHPVINNQIPAKAIPLDKQLPLVKTPSK